MSATQASRKAATVSPALEPLYSIDDLAAYLNVDRRTVERMRSAGKLPKPDIRIGKLPRWRPETIREWMAAQARSN